MLQESQVSPRYDKAITSVPELLSYIEENNLSIKTLDNAHKRIKDPIVRTYVNKCVAAVICNYSSLSLTFSISELYQYVNALIKLCSHNELSYVHHSIVILEHVAVQDGTDSLCNLSDDASDEDSIAEFPAHETLFLNNKV
jgi:hypothetical protein